MNLITGLEIYSVCATIGFLVLGLKLLQLGKRTESEPEAELLDRLLPLLIQYQTLRQIIANNPELPAQQLIPLLVLLDHVVIYWHLEPIGQVWQAVPFTPQFHQADNDEIQLGETVYIRFIGYRSGDKIYAPAKVSRQLPPHAL